MYHPIAENTLLRHLAEDRDRKLTHTPGATGPEPGARSEHPTAA